MGTVHSWTDVFKISQRRWSGNAPARQPATIVPIGLLELACTALYLVPRTAVLGAVLLTGYLGGAVVTHVRVGEYGPALGPVIFGVLLWGGLYLRDERIRALLPLRRPRT